MGKEKKLIFNLTGYVLLAAAAVFGTVIMLQTFSGDIWYDEVFSVRFVKDGWKDIVAYTIKDVHPPLYYFYLKMCTGIFGFLGIVTAGKIASVIPLFVMLLISVIYVRKRYGTIEMGIFALLVTVMPQMAVYYSEIRMYSLALVFITVAGIMLIDIVDEERSKPWKWAVFFVFSLCAAYTQYFTAVAAAGLYIVLLIYYLIPANRNRKKIWGVGGMIAGSAVAYLPWLPSFIKQVKTVKGSYWIQPMTLRSIPGCLKFIFLPVSGEGNVTYLAAGFTIAVCALVYIVFLFGKKKPKGTENVAAFSGIAALILIVMVGFAATVLKSPIFTYRYMVPVLGLFYLGIVAALNKTSKTYLYFAVILAVLFTGYLSVNGFCYEEQKKIDEFEKASQVLSDIPNGSVIISNFDHVVTISSFYLPDSHIYQYEGEPDKLVEEMFPNYESMVNDEAVRQLIKDNSNVFFFGSFVSRDEIVQNWDDIKITSEYEGECLVERYWFNIYRLGLRDE